MPCFPFNPRSFVPLQKVLVACGTLKQQAKQACTHHQPTKTIPIRNKSPKHSPGSPLKDRPGRIAGKPQCQTAAGHCGKCLVDGLPLIHWSGRFRGTKTTKPLDGDFPLFRIQFGEEPGGWDIDLGVDGASSSLGIVWDTMCGEIRVVGCGIGSLS